MQTLQLKSKFSPSAINEFYSCPKQWQLHRLGACGIAVNRDFMDLGKLVHEAIKEYFNIIGNKPTPQNINRIFTTVFEQHFEQYSLNRLRIRANRLRDNFILFEIERVKTWKIYSPTLVEVKLKTENYVTIVDFYSQPHKTLIDWKSGNKRDLTDNDLRQGKVMEIVLKKNGYPVEKILFVGLYPNRVFEVPKIPDGFVDNEKNKMLESVHSNYFPKRGLEKGYCRWCDVVLDCFLEGCNLWML